MNRQTEQRQSGVGGWQGLNITVSNSLSPYDLKKRRQND